jgi:hypothetical protein
MAPDTDRLEHKLMALMDQWRQSGLPGRNTLLETAEALRAWKQSAHLQGLWKISPGLATATIDDAWGMGLDIIEAYAEVLGMSVMRIGLEVSSQTIISACHTYRPDYLGMTVLQFDTEEDLCMIGKAIPEKTKIIVGGPIFKSDPDLAKRAGIHFVAKDLPAFLQLFLSQQRKQEPS